MGDLSTPASDLNGLAYAAFCASVAVRGKVPPRWKDLSARRRRSWRAAVRAICSELGVTLNEDVAAHRVGTGEPR